ncbi:Alb1-domain-containing protein [Truncatella angustata]|uniref:Alb1-domain-containing protein n=1 Tax=Truncatella angustata TaxID=152316 RepID=A0A9P8ZTL1_9PEZI|nr:Alb1-domain-containing protein [Truncatella angustata]KAH6649025.1 Alb1-domain-containing protein [Truncatella angustata]KAH8201775.1 hypothetical protein TruAng_004039 [Truncatella angustata]
MGKGTITKNRGLSKHSRAARRATDVDIDTDKSLKEVRPPKDDSINNRPSVLAIHQGAGISKKQKNGRNMSSRAKKRAEEKQDKAAAIMERTENKIEKSKNSAKTVLTRRKNWEDINKDVPLDKNPFANLGDDDEDEEEEEEEESEADDEIKQANAAVLQAQAAPATMGDDDDDQVL